MKVAVQLAKKHLASLEVTAASSEIVPETQRT